MNSEDCIRFQRVLTRPRWEGLIFTGIDFSDQRISVSEAEPTPQLRDYIENIWFMKWNMKDTECLKCIVVPNPCAKLVVLQQDGKTFSPIVAGPKKDADFFELRGSGATVGFDFKPGGLYALFEKPMNDWSDSQFSNDILKEMPPVSKEVWTNAALSKWLNSVDKFFIDHLRAPSKNFYEKITAVVEGTLQGRYKTPEEMAHESGLSIRTLQRVFKAEVGVSPRDLLRIARFNEAIRQIAQDDLKMFADIAIESGFFDQPHMTNEFQKLVATLPSKFRRYL